MAAATTNLTIEQGATFVHTFTWNDSNGDPVDLTGYSAEMHIRRSKDSTTTELELSTTNNRISLGSTLGTIQLSIDYTDTASLNFTNGVYDLELLSPGDVKTRLVEGTITLSKEVTK